LIPFVISLWQEIDKETYSLHVWAPLSARVEVTGDLSNFLDDLALLCDNI